MVSAEFCGKKLEELVIVIRFKSMTYLSICVLNALFSVVATLGNLLVIRALWKASSVTLTLKKMFLSLAFCDLAVGLFSQPVLAALYGVIVNKAASGNYDFDSYCPVIITLVMAPTFFLLGVSFSMVAAIAVDRLLALSIHLRYQELVTEKRVNIGLVVLWLSNALYTFVFMELPSHNELLAVILQTVGLILITVAYFRIYQVVRYHQNQIHGHNQIQNDQSTQAARIMKSALNAFYVYIVSLVCFTPNLLAGILLVVDNSRLPTLVAYNASAFLILLNSSLNPLVYCWRYREIRNIVKNTVKKLFRNNQMAQ
ncbi:adenosine receptor A3-like [Orbicella faveolata]|uniref:adenosine receptor A3-like n=1 Tax=Orbicella faveolata TaxID=48498 RepID=UPI0009E36116|nr:adenosine receptor A3-like [Orbicella faveolata]XP_020611692.1 adenosine receptor A3-like [Orbicella faveolata]